ncbi:hypothetical protein DH2020_018848 [Rehmannia glutinosa]|uniref:F-box associated beta-propeller type 1 domain-containing protein n=1 Tax=Rehmannia glutinosa TaxID=99300 RepID=A0ABR0WK31_REHGL
MIIFFTGTCAKYIDFASVCNAIDPPILKEVTYPWHGKDCYFGGAAGPYNGLFCIYTDVGGAFLWNPSTRKHFQVPQLHLPDEVETWSWGFGYDSNSDDYKVVMIVACSKQLALDGTDKLTVYVYSLKSGLWERIADFPYFSIDLQHLAVCVGDALHWKVNEPYQYGSSLIVALHLGKLEYHLVPQPPIKTYKFDLGVLDGCLYAIYYNYDGSISLVMKEYGVEESWTLLISCTGWSKFLVKPLAYTEDGDELIFVTQSNLIVRCEFETGTFKTSIRRCLSHNLLSPLVYMPNLVCPQTGVRDG